jgi:hypothetical protein
MGTACCISLSASDWISIFAILVNGGLAVWIVNTIQNRMTNKRTLKDHFISEVKEIRNDYKTLLSNLYSDKMIAKELPSRFKLMNIKVSDIMTLIFDKYRIDKTMLSPYQNNLRELITENEDFIKNFEKENSLKFSENSKIQIMKFQQDNNHLFNELIIKINDSE